MLKKIKLKNSTELFAGIILIVLGIAVGFFELFEQRKEETFSDMNILLYESETPKAIESEEEVKDEEPLENNEETEEPKEEPKETVYDYIGILEIPKIGLKRGFVDINSRYNDVSYNITIIRGSTFPDVENNNLILAAHSGICSVCFFDRLYNLSNGDIAYLTYKGIKHSYKIVNIYEVEKDGTVPIYRDYNKNVLTLITCTRYSNTKQTVYILEEY